MNLEPLSTCHAEAACALLRDPEVMRYYVDTAGQPYGRERAERVVSAWISASGRQAVMVDGRFAGVAGVVEMDWLDGYEGVPEVTYRLLPAYWGQGLAVSAMRAVLNARSGPVIGACTDDNARSVRVLEKLGFAFERAVPYVSAESGVRAMFLVHRWLAEGERLEVAP